MANTLWVIYILVTYLHIHSEEATLITCDSIVVNLNFNKTWIMWQSLNFTWTTRMNIYKAVYLRQVTRESVSVLQSHENPSTLSCFYIVTGGYFLPHDDRMLCRFCFIYECTTASLQCKVPCMHTKQHILITLQTDQVGDPT